MKIRTQDATQCVEFGDCFVVSDSFGVCVCVRTLSDHIAVTAGNYEDVARAKGVVLEIGQAYEKDQRLFYMPLE